MRKLTVLLLISASIMLSGCGRFQGVNIHGFKGVKFRGMKDNKLLLNLKLDVENPNKRRLTIKKFEFKAWLNKRELGNMHNTEKIKLEPKSRVEYEVPVEITLRTAADALKLLGSGEKLLDQLIVEGYIKGCSFPVSKKIRIEKQPFSQLMNAYKDSVNTKDSLSGGN